MLIDCHSHLHVPEFETDQAAVIERARAGGITRFINVGFDIEGNFKALALAKKHDDFYSTMGVHPHLASDWNEEIGERIARAVQSEPKIVALGEMGLDYFKNFQPKEVQQHAFRAQLQLARKFNLPVIIHCRDAFEDVFEILEQEKNERVLLHCFTGTRAQAQIAFDRGYYIAFTGILTYPSAQELQEVARMAPADKIVIETDCPYLAPQSKRGQRNEPSFLPEVAEKLAQLRGMPLAQLEDQLVMNTKQLFRIE
ncbi:TatD family hydrolase [Candidatus Gracilibacteria bacterium]|nr:TatD family hydrolase [Candidatus Gracilibacteria bacterium]